jgi:hypothetical protein
MGQKLAEVKSSEGNQDSLHFFLDRLMSEKFILESSNEPDSIEFPEDGKLNLYDDKKFVTRASRYLIWNALNKLQPPESERLAVLGAFLDGLIEGTQETQESLQDHFKRYESGSTIDDYRFFPIFFNPDANITWQKKGEQLVGDLGRDIITVKLRPNGCFFLESGGKGLSYCQDRNPNLFSLIQTKWNEFMVENPLN